MKIKPLALSLLTATLSLPSLASAVSEVHSIRGIDNTPLAYLKDRDGDLLYFITVNFGASPADQGLVGFTRFQPQHYSTAEELIAAWQDTGYGLVEPYDAILENYPAMPSSSEGRQAFEDLLNTALTDDATYKELVDKKVTQEFFSTGLPVQDESEFLFYGASESHAYFIDASSILSTPLYRCDKRRFAPSVAVDEQSLACSVDYIPGSDLRSLQLRTVINATAPYTERVVITDTVNGQHKQYAGQSSTFSFYQPFELYSTTQASPGEIAYYPSAEHFDIAILEPSGRSALSILGYKFFTRQTTSQNNSFEVNRDYYAYIDSPLNEPAVLNVCAYDWEYPEGWQTGTGWNIDQDLTCYEGNTRSLNETTLLDNLIPLGSTTSQAGFIRSFTLAPATPDIATAYYGGSATKFATPVIIDIESGEQTYISKDMTAAISNRLGSDFVSAVEAKVLTHLDSSLVENYPLMPSSPEAAGLAADVTQEQFSALMAEIINRSAMQQGVYADFIEDGDLDNFNIDSNVEFEAQHWDTNVFRYLDKWTLQTPTGTYVFTRPGVSGYVTLPGGDVPPEGINVTLLSDNGHRVELVTDATGYFKATNVYAQTYNITFNYPNHVSDCAIATKGTESSGNFELKAGDLTGDGIIDRDDIRRIWVYKQYPMDYDLNNDGKVSWADVMVVYDNQGAVQCDL